MRAEGTPDPYAGFETRIVPENITLLPKTAQPDHRRQRLERARDHGQEGREHRHHPASELGATPDEIKAIAAALGPRGRDNGLKEGQKLRVLVAAADRRRGCSRSA